MIVRRSRGYSLIEMLTVIALLGVVIGLVGVMSISLRRSERATHADMAEDMTYLRLSRDFRRDVHRATTLEEIADKETTGIRLASTDGPFAVYRAEGHSVSRSAMKNDGTATAVERYTLGRTVIPRFVREDDVVSLRFGTAPSARRELTARLNHDARFDTKGGDE